MKENYLWTEKYRPKTLNDCVLPDRIKSTLQEYFDKKELPNMILTGTPGCGKGSLINAIIHELNADVLFLNCGINGNISDLRVTITNFATSVSLLDDHKKVVVLDEIDSTKSPMLLDSLKAFIENYSSNALFILTANNASKITDALYSRCFHINYNKEISKDETPNLMKQFMKRCCFVLDNEDIKYDKKVIASLIKSDFPDFRKSINNLQQYSASGEIDTGILAVKSSNISDVIDMLKDKDFKSLKDYVETENLSDDIYQDLYKQLLVSIENSSIPEMIVTINEYQYKSAFVINKDINILALMVEIMMNLEFK